ncbi:MAG: hypothetical protein ACRDYV_06150 [Acidimicrobiia bacterium]
MVAEAGNFYVVLPFMAVSVGALLVIWWAFRTDRKRPQLPNLTARRKHPLRHLQVELNKAKKTGKENAASEQGGAEAEEKDKPKRRGDDGPGQLRRLK